jgi:hypothetical protein
VLAGMKRQTAKKIMIKITIKFSRLKQLTKIPIQVIQCLAHLANLLKTNIHATVCCSLHVHLTTCFKMNLTRKIQDKSEEIHLNL